MNSSSPWEFVLFPILNFIEPFEEFFDEIDQKVIVWLGIQLIVRLSRLHDDVSQAGLHQLADVFNAFQHTAITEDGLEPLNFYSIPGFS